MLPPFFSLRKVLPLTPQNKTMTQDLRTKQTYFFYLNF